jgi:DNA-binding transcriptional regulator YhcF (GntR family)
MQTQYVTNKASIEHITQLIIDGIEGRVFAEGDPVPSTKQLAMELRVNPRIVMAAYQDLVEQGVLCSDAPHHLHVCLGASELLRELNREALLQRDLPQLSQRARQLGLTSRQVIDAILIEGNYP